MNDARPRFSVVVPAYNEAAYLPVLMASLREAERVYRTQGGGTIDILVVDNASTDDTAEVARSLGARVVPEPQRQIAAARNAGAKAAQGEVIVTCDADNRVSPRLFVRMDEELKSGALGGGVLILPEERRWNTDLLFGLFDGLARLSGLGFGVLFTDRETFWTVGGFPEDVYVGEDGFFVVALRREARRRRLRFVQLRDAPVWTSLRKIDEFGFLNILWQHLKFVLMPWRLSRREAAATWYNVRKS